jgi:hypothetical protein
VDVRIFNNTALNMGTAGRFLSAGSDTQMLALANNLYVAPNLQTGSYGSANVFVLDENLQGFSEIRNNLWAEPAVVGWGDGWHYCWPQWSHPDGYLTPEEWRATGKPRDEMYRRFQESDLDAEFSPQFDASGGRAARGVHTDLHGHLRPLTGAVTCGAVQAGQ